MLFGILVASFASDARRDGIHAARGVTSEAAGDLCFLNRPACRFFHSGCGRISMPDGKIQAVERVVEAHLALEQGAAVFIQIGLAHCAESECPNDRGSKSLSAFSYGIRDSSGLSPDGVCVAASG